MNGVNRGLDIILLLVWEIFQKNLKCLPKRCILSVSEFE
jgi:hypothetical protein